MDLMAEIRMLWPVALAGAVALVMGTVVMVWVELEALISRYVKGGGAPPWIAHRRPETSQS